MFGERSVHQQGRARYERRIQTEARAVLFAINVKSDVVSLSAGLPQQRHAVRPGSVSYHPRGKTLQLNLCRRSNGFGLRGKIVEEVGVYLVREHGSGIRDDARRPRKRENGDGGSAAIG